MIQPTGPLMGYFSSTLMQITDGNAAWEEFFSGVQNAFENNAASAPKIAGVLGCDVDGIFINIGGKDIPVPEFCRSDRQNRRPTSKV